MRRWGGGGDGAERVCEIERCCAADVRHPPHPPSRPLARSCREVRNAARILGDPRLYRKMELASAAIKRDIVFVNSLYLA